MLNLDTELHKAALERMRLEAELEELTIASVSANATISRLTKERDEFRAKLFGCPDCGGGGYITTYASDGYPEGTPCDHKKLNTVELDVAKSRVDRLEMELMASRAGHRTTQGCYESELSARKIFQAENARLRAALEACAEGLELQLAGRSMPCESASPKSDTDSFGGTRALMEARAALAGKEQKG